MKFVATFIIFCLISHFGSSQIVNQIGNSIKKSATTQATDYNRTRSNKELNLNNGQTPEKVSPPADENEDSEKKETDTTSFGGTLKDEYVFANKVLFKLLSVDKDEPTTLNYFFSDSVFMMTPTEKDQIINDYRKNKMLVLDKESKSGMLTALISPQMAEVSKAMSSMYKKTGRTKSIAGFTCNEYLLTSPDNKKVSVWVSPTNPLKDLSELGRSNLELFFMNFGVISPESGSLTMGFEVLNEEGKTDLNVYYESFSNETSQVNLAEYEILTY